MPFVPLNAETAAPQRGFSPIGEELAAPRRGFQPLSRPAPIVPATPPTSPTSLSSGQAAAQAAPFDREQLLGEYPGLAPYDFAVRRSGDGADHRGEPYNGRRMEFYPPGEAWSFDQARPAIELFDDSMTPRDVMGELYSHYLPRVDPEFKAGREQFVASLSEAQKKRWLRPDYEFQRREGLFQGSFDEWLAGPGGDAFFRGYVTEQYPREAYTPEQAALLGELEQRLRATPALPEARAMEPGWWERVSAAFQSHEGLSQNIGDLIADRVPEVDPATGKLLTEEQRRGDRLAVEARQRDALGVDAPDGVGELSADILGAIAREATDPLALMTGGIGAGATGMARLLQLAAAGGVYEGVSASAEQLSDSGRITSPGEIALRSGAGAVLTPALDLFIRGIGVGIKRLLERRRQPSADKESIDADIREGVLAAAEEGERAGVPREETVGRLIELVQTDEGAFATPRRDVFDAPAPGEGAPEPVRGFTPVGEAAETTPRAPAPEPGSPQAEDAAGRRRGNMAQLAEEYDRLARATTDPTIRTELLRKAEFARGEAEGAAPKLTPKERAERARRVDPATDSIDVAIRKLGGIDTDLETDWSGRLVDVPRVFGLPALERPGKGLSLDALAERLYELGYLSSYDQGELANLLGRVERGEAVLSNQASGERFAEAAGLTTDRDFRFELDAVEPADVGTDFVIDTDAGTVVPARPIDLEDLRRLEEEEANARAWFDEEAPSAADERGGLPGARGAGAQERLADPAAGRPGDQPRPGEALELRSYDDAELRAERERRERLDAEEEARAREAEARAAADLEVGGFTLTGSDRAADANPAQLDLSSYNPRIGEPGSPDVRQPGRGDIPPSGRRSDAVPEQQQLELFAREGDDTAQTVAALEAFGPRVRYTGTGRLATGTRQVTSPGDAAHVVAQLRKEPQESLLAIVTDDAGDVLRVVRHTVGTRDASQVDPGLMAAAAHSTPGGRRVWFVHQHPSGDATQSTADARITERLHELLRDTGVTPEGMVVVAPGGRYSHVHPDPSIGTTVQGDRIPAAVRSDQVDVEERRFQRMPPGGEQVTSPAKMREVLDATARGRDGVLLLDTKHVPVGFLPMSARDMVRLRQGDSSPAAELFRALDETNATATAAAIETPDLNTLAQVHGNLSAFASKADRRHLDTINADGTSAASMSPPPSAPSTFYANPFDQAIRFGARTLRNNTAAAVPGGLGGGMAGGMLSDEEPGSARWWVDVGFGALAGALASSGLFGAARRANIIGEGSIADLGVQRAGTFLGKLLGRGPEALENAKRQQRLMRQLLDRQAHEIGEFLRDNFTPSERALMSDLIENRGIVPDLNRVHRQAQALDEFLSFITAKHKEYGTLPPGVEEGGYLHRYYAKHLGLDKTFQEAKRQSLSGSYTIARGMVDTFQREYMSRGVTTIVDEIDSLLTEKSFLERGLYEKAGGVRGARDLDSGAVKALPDEAVLRPPPGTASGQATPRMTMTPAEAARRMVEIDERLRELRKIDLVEMVGEQNGRPRAFFFTRDEVGRVDSGVDPVLARMQRRPQPAPASPGDRPALEAPLLTPSPGRASGQGSPPPQPSAPRSDGPPAIEELSPTERVWQVKTSGGDGVKLKRDWTRRERDAWGEIRDAGYRFVRGMAEASHDLSLAKLFNDVAARKDWVSAEAQVTREGEWVQVPKGKARTGAGLERYGQLAGKYVRPDVWRAIKRYGVAPRVLGSAGEKRVPLVGATVQDVYRGALNRWKLWHTVYNPVTHFNNTYSNVEMLYMGGYGPRDLARGLREYARGDQGELWREARDAGVLDSDFGTATLREGGGIEGTPLERLAEQLRTQRDDADASLAVDTLLRAKEWWIGSRNAVEQADGAWRTGLEVAKAAAKPVGKGLGMIKRPVDVAARSAQRLYRFEDNVFKMAVFAAERRAGRSVEQARKAAQDLFFDYSDLPDSVKFIRDFPIGSPFISYTYKALPAIARNIVRNPERVLGLLVAYEAANFASLVSSGMDPDAYFETMDAYEDTLPPWDSGRSLWGARNFVVLPGADNLVALGRSHALGNPFMADSGDRAAAVPGITAFWGSDIFGGNPLHALYDVLVNEDWRGREIYHPGAPDGTKAKKALSYLYQSWAPSNILTPGSYHQTKVLEGLANDARENPDGMAAPIVAAANSVAEALGLEQFTGLTRGGDEVETGEAVAGTLGVKYRGIDTQRSIEIESSRIEREIQEKEASLTPESRLASEGRKTQAQFESEQAAVLADIEKLTQELDELQRARDVLQRHGLLEGQESGR